MNKSLIFLIAIVAVLAIGITNSFGGSGGIQRPVTFADPKFEVEELTAYMHGEGNVIVVSGKIRNLSYSTVKGYGIVYFLSSDQDVIQSVETEVNKGNSFPHGKTGYFETAANIENLPGVENVVVEFKRQ